MFDVIAVGELLIDFTPSGTNDQGIALFGQNPGGAPANVLAMNTRLGGRTAFIGKVGDDQFGHYLRGILVQGGIDVSGLIVDPHSNTTLAFVHLNEQGDRSFSFYRDPGADMLLTSEEIDRGLIDSGAIFHFGAVSLTDEPCRSAVFDAVKYARQQGKLVSYDPNFRPALWDDVEEAKEVILRGVPDADILKVSEEELELLTGEADLQKGAGILAAQGPSLIVVSLGPKGAFYCCKNGCGTLPTYDVKTVDTTGAGDAFLGAIHYRLRGKSLDGLRALSTAEMEDIIDFANAAGSLTTAGRGAIPSMPTIEQVETCRKTVALLK